MQLTNLQSLFVDRDRKNIGALVSKNSSGTYIARILDDCQITRVEKHSSNTLQSLLITRKDGNLVGTGFYCSGPRYVSGDCLAKLWVALRVAPILKCIAVR